MAEKNSQEGKIRVIFQRFRQSRETGLILVLLLIGIILSFSTPVFFTSENLLNILKQVTLVTIVACGQTFVLTSGGIDLSVGSILGLSSIIMSWFLVQGVPVPAAMIICLLFGTTLGLCNGFMITRLSLPPFIITLGMQSIARGFVLVITKGYPIMVASPLIIALGQGNIGILPIMIFFLPVTIIVTHWIYNYQVFGNRVKAIGGNETASGFQASTSAG
jgi:ribose transport system permease protein